MISKSSDVGFAGSLSSTYLNRMGQSKKTGSISAHRPHPAIWIEQEWRRLTAEDQVHLASAGKALRSFA